MDDVENKIRRTAPTLDQILRGLASSSCRGATRASKCVVTIGSMLLNLQSQCVNAFQMMTALYLHGTNTPKRTITALATTGLSVSYLTLQIALQNLTKEHIENIVLMMESCTYFFVWDNINIAERKLDQRIGNKDDFISGTTSSIAFDKDLKDLKIIHTPKDTLTLDKYDLDEEHCVSYRSNFNAVNIPVPVVDVLPPKKTLILPLPAMKINQASTEGNNRVINSIKKTLRLTNADFENTQIVIAGDMLTVTRIESLQNEKEEDLTAFDRMEWAVPVLGLFHLEMNLCNTILVTHFGNGNTRGSLASFEQLLGRKRVNPESSDYHAKNEFLRHIFEAMVLQLWHTVLGSTKLDDLDTKVGRMVAKVSIIAAWIHPPSPQTVMSEEAKEKQQMKAQAMEKIAKKMRILNALKQLKQTIEDAFNGSGGATESLIQTTYQQVGNFFTPSMQNQRATKSMWQRGSGTGCANLSQVIEQQDGETDQGVLEEQDEETDQGDLDSFLVIEGLAAHIEKNPHLRCKPRATRIIHRLWQHRLKVVSRVVLKGMQADLDKMVKAKADAICDTYFRNTEILMTQFNNVDVNAAIFIRDMMVYMELSSSIKAGDVGHILNVMRMTTIMFQGGNIPNYAKALMRFIAGARHKWHPKKTPAILSTMVVNTRGTENSFIPTDLYQEHNNFLTKAVHAAKAGNMVWGGPTDKSTANIRLYSTITSIFEEEIEMPYTSNHHSSVSAQTDIFKILGNLKSCNILSGNQRETALDSVPVVTDLFEQGYTHLATGGFERFQGSMETQDTNQSRLLDVGDSEATDSSDMEGIDDYLGDLDGPNNSDNDLSDGLSDEEDFNDIDPKKCE
ncbi:MAG: hypothetical protein BYD32DRAFT_457684 [Podila humilis]|nr:MAG: hypothetical protein BYD32DRAFT_457684 [Podila humilis]